MYRIGNGYDVHRFERGKKLILGGILINSDYGLKAHSDGDVLIHSIIDALLGASSNGDIGDFFPDNDHKYKDISSVLLLEKVLKLLQGKYNIVNIDTVIICEKPKISPYKEKIKINLAKILNIKNSQINIKATTMEKMDDIGKGSGISVMSSCILKII